MNVLDQTTSTNTINTMNPTTIISTLKPEKKKRATVEYNGMEFVLAIIYLFDDVNSYADLCAKIEDMRANPAQYASIIRFNDPVDFENYVLDVTKKHAIVTEYISIFRASNTLPKVPIKCIYISGKINKHTKITELNKGCDKKAAKADIYIEYIDESKPIDGISAKQSSDATKSNYSVHKMLGKDLDKDLTTVKKDYLKGNGFTSFDKAQRSDVNKLFYPQNKTNPYWLRIREEIKKNYETILMQLLQALYCANVNYDIYEFDGTSFIKLNKVIDMTTATFEEHMPYYFDKSGAEREAAKLFYRLTVGEKIYRVEIRWKGNVYNAAPQFQIHNDEDA